MLSQLSVVPSLCAVYAPFFEVLKGRAMATMSPTLGIDFGTSNSAVGYAVDGVPHLITVEAGQNTLPTALFFDNEEKRIIYGRGAQEALIGGEDGRYMRALKSLLGTPLMRESRVLLGKRMDFIAIVARFLAELTFQKLWEINDETLAIGIHHGSLDREQRTRVEAAMVRGDLRAIVCTGSLDLGIDWGDVDLVIQIGAPKNVKRLVQRIGRANHRYNAPSKALLVPANRFEVVECVAALQAVLDGDLDGEPRGAGPRDVLCQHILICLLYTSDAADE